SGSNGAVLADTHRHNVRMNFRSGVRGVEELLAKSVGHCRTGESFIQQYRPVGHSIVEFFPGGMPMFSPLIRMPATHGCDPLAFRHFAPSRPQRFLNFPNRSRVLQNRVIAGTIREAHTMDMPFDDSRNDGATF